jgi:hypothetical protein
MLMKKSCRGGRKHNQGPGGGPSSPYSEGAFIVKHTHAGHMLSSVSAARLYFPPLLRRDPFILSRVARTGGNHGLRAPGGGLGEGARRVRQGGTGVEKRSSGST